MILTKEDRNETPDFMRLSFFSLGESICVQIDSPREREETQPLRIVNKLQASHLSRALRSAR